MRSLSSFSPEVLEMIMKNLEVKDLINLSLVSKCFNKILNRPDMWTNVMLCKRRVAKEGIMGVFWTKFRRFKILNLSFVLREEWMDLFTYLSAIIISNSISNLTLCMMLL